MSGTYLVRVRETHVIVGIFWADNLDILLDAIDEWIDPSCCQMRKVKFSSVYFPTNTFKVPAVSNEDDGEWEGREELQNHAFGWHLGEAIEAKTGWRNCCRQDDEVAA